MYLDSRREILDSSVNHISNCVDASDAKLEKWNLGKRPSRNVTTRLDHWEFHSKERKEENSSFDSKNVRNSESYFWRWHSKNWTTVVHFRPLKHTLPSIYTLITITFYNVNWIEPFFMVKQVQHLITNSWFKN